MNDELGGMLSCPVLRS